MLILDIYWIGGFLTLILGSVLNALSLDYGNVLMLACTSGLSIIFNTILAITLLGEKLHQTRIIGMSFIILGSILFLWNAKNDSETYTEAELFALYKRAPSVSYFLIAIAIIATVYYIDFKIKRDLRNHFKLCSEDAERQGLLVQHEVIDVNKSNDSEPQKLLYGVNISMKSMIQATIILH